VFGLILEADQLTLTGQKRGLQFETLSPDLLTQYDKDPDYQAWVAE
jgi:hypothetical protein